MKLPFTATVSALAAVATATDHWQSVWCSDGGQKETVTVTTTVNAGGAAPSQSASSSYVASMSGMVTSVNYNPSTTSTYLPSAGTYKNPYGGDSITVGKATWTTTVMPVSTVYQYKDAGATCTATKAVYGNGQPLHAAEIVIIVIVVKDSTTTTSYSTQTGAPTSAPPPPPPISTSDSAPSAHQTFSVTVGARGKNIYEPDRLENVKKDDVIVFTFLAKNHTLTQSNFNTPCTSNGMFDTGFNQFNPKNDSNLFKIPFTVPDDTKPLWFSCAQTGHCLQGMVFGINTQGKMDDFIAKAKASNGTTTGTLPPPPPGSTGTNPSAPGTTGTTPPNSIQTVTVGLDKGKTLRFDPPFLQNVKRGSIVHFDFRAANHTLTESTFEKPCTKLSKDGTIDTNFDHANKDDIPNLKPFDFTFPDDKPRYFYCKQANGTPNGHCGKGMVFSVNVDEKRFQEFQKNAEATLPKIKGRAPELGWQGR